MVRRTGAEKPRSSDGVGGEGMSRNSKTCSRSVTSSNPSLRDAPPSSFKRQLVAVRADQTRA